MCFTVDLDDNSPVACLQTDPVGTLLRKLVVLCGVAFGVGNLGLKHSL